MATGTLSNQAHTATTQKHRPNLFIVGAAKCGTTSLHAYLAQHPQVFMARNKEPHYFGSDLDIVPPWRVTNETDYFALFTEAHNADIIGEASTWYLYSTQAAQQIKAFSPDARIIIMLRHPADFINSLHLQTINGAEEDILDLREALDAEDERAQGRRIAPGCRFRDSILYRRAARFSGQVERYLNTFPHDQIRIYLLEDLAKDTSATLRDVFSFLEIDPTAAINLERENVTRNVSRFDLKLKQAFYRSPAFRRAFNHIPKPLLKAYRHVSSNWLPTIRAKRFDPNLRAQLTTEFSEEIDRVAQLIGRDLSHWKQTD